MFLIEIWQKVSARTIFILETSIDSVEQKNKHIRVQLLTDMNSELWLMHISSFG